MPIARVQMPNGKIGRFEVPEGFSPAQIESLALNQHHQESKSSVSGAGFRGIEQGVTMGGADEIKAGIGAGIASLATDDKFSDLYKESLASQNKQLRTDYDTQPEASIGGNVVGALATGGLVKKGLEKALPQTAKFLSVANTKKGAIAKNALVGATTSAPAGALSADPTNGESRAEGAKNAAALGLGLGSVAGALTRKTGVQQPLTDEMKKAFFEGGSPAHLGEELTSGIGGAEKLAKQAKTGAYDAAEIAGKKVSTAPQFANELADHIDRSISGIDAELSPAAKSIRNYTKDLRGLANQPNVSLIKFNTFETLRKRLNAIPYNAENSVAKTTAIKAFDDIQNKILEKGLLQGDEGAITLIKEARDKNAYWRSKFTGKDANNAVRKYVKSLGKVDEIAPETLLDTFTRVGQMGLDNVKAAKDILGEKASPILKQGYLDKISKSSMTKGELDANKLGKNIYKFINDSKNKSLVNEVFSKEEIKALNVLGDTATKISDKKSPLLATALRRSPFGVGQFVSSFVDAGKQGRQMKALQKPLATTEYKTIYGKFPIGGSNKAP